MDGGEVVIKKKAKQIPVSIVFSISSSITISVTFHSGGEEVNVDKNCLQAFHFISGMMRERERRQRDYKIYSSLFIILPSPKKNENISQFTIEWKGNISNEIATI